MRRFCLLALMSFCLVTVSCGGGSNNTGPGDGNQNAQFIVVAWNDLGMHCLNPTYDRAVVLPPFNTVWAQVIKVGNPPEVVTAGLTVEYSVDNNTYSYGKRDYGQFWDSAVALFGSLFDLTSLPHDEGLLGAHLSGQMAVSGDHFAVTGIPLTPVDDIGHWDPFQVVRITVKGSQGEILAQTRATAPTSDEMNCSKCHGAQAFTDVLTKHDAAHGTNLVASAPVLCAGCHGSPALGTSGPGTSGKYLSQAMHTKHADSGAACYDCHPGAVTKCQRSLRHTADDGHCTTCHGDLATVGGSIPSQRIPWVNEPACATCHTGVADVATGAALYRNSKGHGGVYCEGCHGSPHAMVPSRESSDNYQALQYQGFTGRVKTLGSCGVCHNSSRGGGGDLVAAVAGAATRVELAPYDDDFGEQHGGANPETRIGCHTCHTSLSTNYANWPHAYQWHNSN